MNLRQLFSIVSACGLFALSTSSQAVTLAGNALGEVAVAPHYSTQDGWLTTLNIANKRDVPIALRVNIREGMNGRIVSRFIVALSAFDVYTAVIKPGRTVSDPAVLVGIDQTDSNGRSTCTVPRSFNTGEENPLSTAGFTNTEFLLQTVGVVGLDADATLTSLPVAGEPVGEPVVELLSFRDNDDGGPQGLERLREGYIEFIEMGFAEIDQRGAFGAGIELDANGDYQLDSNGDPVLMLDQNGNPIFDPATSPIYVGNAIEEHNCELVEIAFGFNRDIRKQHPSDPVIVDATGAPVLDDQGNPVIEQDVLASTGNIRRILETARAFGEPINALKFNIRMLNPRLGVEFGVPGEVWSNFYNPAETPFQTSNEQLLIDLLVQQNNNLLDLVVDPTALTDTSTLSLRELLHLRADLLGIDINLGGVVLDALQQINAGLGGGLDFLLALLDPQDSPDPTISCTNRDGDACVRPIDNANCDITRGDPRTSTYLDWRPDGGSPRVGLLRVLQNGVLDPLIRQIRDGGLDDVFVALEGLGLNLGPRGIDVSTISSCRNLITAQTFSASLEPSLNDAYPARVTMYDDTRNINLTVAPAYNTPAGYNLPEDKRGIDAISLTVMRSAAFNEWTATAQTENMEWVIGMPTKPFYTDGATDSQTGLGLVKPGIYSAISPRAESAILESAFGTGLAEATSRPETIISSSLDANVPVFNDGTELLDSSVLLLEQEPYPPFREAFGQKEDFFQLFGFDPNLVEHLVDEVTAAESEFRLMARSCNTSQGALYDRAEQPYIIPQTTQSSDTGLLGLGVHVLPGLLESAQAQFSTETCYVANLVTFGAETVTAGSDESDVLRETNIPFPAPADAGFVDSENGWMQFEFGYAPGSSSGLARLDVGNAVSIDESSLLFALLENESLPLTRLGEDPTQGNFLPFIETNIDGTTDGDVHLFRGSPVIGYASKRRDFGLSGIRNYASAVRHSYAVQIEENEASGGLNGFLPILGQCLVNGSCAGE